MDMSYPVRNERGVDIFRTEGQGGHFGPVYGGHFEGEMGGV